MIQTDPSKTGWGASCQGLTIPGVWSKQERSRAMHFQIDNTTALRYLTKMGGVKSLEMIKLRKEIWDYLLSLGIAITNRGKSRTAATSKMELFLIIVNY